jgi:hypothetical protein
VPLCIFWGKLGAAGWQVFGCFAKMGAMKSTMNLWEKTRALNGKHTRTWSENKSNIMLNWGSNLGI